VGSLRGHVPVGHDAGQLSPRVIGAVRCPLTIMRGTSSAPATSGGRHACFQWCKSTQASCGY